MTHSPSRRVSGLVKLGLFFLLPILGFLAQISQILSIQGLLYILPTGVLAIAGAFFFGALLPSGLTYDLSRAKSLASILVVFGVGMTSIAFAQVTDVDAVNFATHSGDVSIGLLEQVLGRWKSNTKDPTTGAMFWAFNLGVSVFGAALFLYVSTVGTLHSAEDGQLLGRKWGSAFVPLRMAIGSLMIFPLANGFSGIQLIVLWIASAGVGFANWTADVTFNSFIQGQNQTIALKLASQENLVDVVDTILKAEVCMAERNRQYMDEGDTQSPYVMTEESGKLMNTYARFQWGVPAVNSPEFIALSPHQKSLVIGGAVDECGSIEIPSHNTVLGVGNGTGLGSYVVNNVSMTWSAIFKGADLQLANIQIRNAHAKAIRATIQQVRPIAASYVHSTDSNTREKLAAQVVQLAGAYQAEIASGIKGNLPSNESMAKPLVDSVKDAGWATVGAWFYQHTRISSELNELTSYTPTINPPMTKVSDNASEMISKVSQDIAVSAGNSYTQAAITDAGRAGGNASIGGAISAGSGYLTGKATKFVGETMAVDPSNPTNAIIQLKNVGNNILTTIEVGVVAMMAGKAAATVAEAHPAGRVGKLVAGASRIKSGIAQQKPGAAKVVNKITGFMSNTSSAILEGAGGFLLLIIAALGVMLAFWIPMAPFVMWIGSVMGWLIAVLEMIVATPLLAAAHLHPEGEGMSSRYGANGYMIIIEVFAKPVLLVIGFFLASRFSDPFLRFVSGLFFTSSQIASGDSNPGIITFLVMTTMYVLICIGVLNRTFSLIHIIPNSVMRWIGGAGDRFDQAEGTAKDLEGGVRGGLHKNIEAAQGALALGLGFRPRKKGATNPEAGAREHGLPEDRNS